MSWRGAAGALCLAALALGTAAAQPHPGGRWLTLVTAHFHVHVRSEERALGYRAAAEAEAVYAALAAELPAPRRPIELVVADNADITNGAATEYPLPAAFVLATPPVGDVELGNYDRWLHVGLAHELTHVFELDLAGGWWHLARAVFGRMPGLFPNLYAPDWLIEGLAVYYESRLTGRGRERGAFHTAVVRAQEDERGALPIDAARGAGPRWPAGLRPYAFGSRFLAWAAAAWGDSALPRLARETARRPIPYLWLDGALKPEAGLSLSRAWSRWQTDLVAAPADSAAGSTVLVRGLRAAVPPRVSPDGREVLFADDRGWDAPRLAVLERRTGRVRALARLNGEPGIAWEAAGGAIVSQLDFTDPYTLRSDLWEVSADGAERRRSRGLRLRDPDVAPDGAIVATQLGVDGPGLVLRDSVLRAVTSPEPGVEWGQPRFAPDGRTIAAVRAGNGRSQIVLLERSGAVVRDVTCDSAPSRTPAFSPDGAWLFWSSDRTGVAQIYAAHPDSGAGAEWRVTSESFGAYAPAPASDSLYYLAYHHDGFALAAVPLDPARWTRVSEASPPRRRVAAADRDDARDTVVAAERSYRPLPSLLPQYWLPLVQSGAGATWVGALTSGQDVLGRHIYGATVSLGAGAARGK